MREAGLLGQAKSSPLDFHPQWEAESVGGKGPAPLPSGRGVPWRSTASIRVFMTRPDNERFLDPKKGKIIHKAYISCDTPVIYWENSFSRGRGREKASRLCSSSSSFLSSFLCLLSAWPGTAFHSCPGPWGPPPTSWLTTPSPGHSTENGAGLLQSLPGGALTSAKSFTKQWRNMFFF